MKSAQILFEQRLGRLLGGFAILFALLLARLFHLQTAGGAEFREKIENSRIERVELPAGRGRILDRRGRTLAETVERYDLSVQPSVFRERNLVDAVGDLAMIYCPDLLPPFASPPVSAGLDRLVELRLARFRATAAQLTTIVPRLLAIDCEEVLLESFEAEPLGDALAPVLWPRGELILPATALGRRVHEALLVLAGNDRITTRLELRRRLREGGRVGDALQVDAAAVAARFEEEWGLLTRLAGDAAKGDIDAFLRRLFLREQQDRRRVDRRMDEVLDDKIALGRFGTYDLEQIDDEARSSLADELQIPSANVEKIAAAWEDLAGLRVEEADPEDRRRIEAGVAVLAGREPRRLDAAELEALARVLRVWSDDPEVLKRELGDRLRRSPDYDERRGDLVAGEKEWARRLQFKGGVPFDLFSGLGFDAACQVWNSFGYRGLGFEVRAARSRSYADDAEGVATFLIGRVSDEDLPLGGLEQRLSGPDSWGRPGPLAGRPGQLVRRREVDRSVTELEGSVAPQWGRDVVLAIDIELQRGVELELERMIRERRPCVGGAACVIDLATGDVLALAYAPRVSGEAWKQRVLADGDRTRERRALNEAHRRGELGDVAWRDALQRNTLQRDREPVYDRASSAGDHTRYPPGSVMKIFHAAALLGQGLVDPAEVFPSKDRGPVDMRGALVKSSNEYFRSHAKSLGTERLLDVYADYGMFRPVPWLVDPASGEARRRLAAGEHLKNLAIGEGSLASSSLEIANMFATFARRGQRITPRIVLAIGDDRQPVMDDGRVELPDAVHALLLDAMIEVGRKGRPDSEVIELAAKTGTTQLEGPWGELHDAASAGFAPAHAPRLAAAVFLERAPAMGATTVPTLARILKLALESER